MSEHAVVVYIRDRIEKGFIGPGDNCQRTGARRPDRSAPPGGVCRFDALSPPWVLSSRGIVPERTLTVGRPRAANRCVCWRGPSRIHAEMHQARRLLEVGAAGMPADRTPDQLATIAAE